MAEADNPLLLAMRSTKSANPLLDAMKVKPAAPSPTGGIGSAQSPRNTALLAERRDLDKQILTAEKQMASGSGGRGGAGLGEYIEGLRGKQSDIDAKISSGKNIRISSGDVAREVVNAPVRGAINTVLGGVAGVSDLLGFDDAAETVRAKRDSITGEKGSLRAPDQSQSSFGKKLSSYGEGLGSIAPFLATGGTAAVARGIGAARGFQPLAQHRFAIHRE